MLNNKTVLITGGTGSFGRAFIKSAFLIEEHSPKKLIIFSRDEWKQHEMKTSGFDDKRIRYFIGNIRDPERLYTALNGVDIVIHAAALKQVPTCEYNPFEAVKTNVIGAQNLINTTIRRKVKKVVALSTDKAVNPTNLYGATKLCAEKMFMAANNYSAGTTLYSVVRYGNVIGSRGSVIPLFQKQLKEGGKITLTNFNMTRFWITLDRAVEMVYTALRTMKGGEIFVPRICSMSMTDLVDALRIPTDKIKIIGLRPGEKMRETLVSEDETVRTDVKPGYFVIRDSVDKVETVYRETSYSSDTNPSTLTIKELRRILCLN